MNDVCIKMDAFLKKAKKTATQDVSKQAQLDTLATPLLSENALVMEFYGQLSEKEKIAHSIAVDKLGTSYDVTRTHGYLQWLKKRVT